MMIFKFNRKTTLAILFLLLFGFFLAEAVREQSLFSQTTLGYTLQNASSVIAAIVIIKLRLSLKVSMIVSLMMIFVMNIIVLNYLLNDPITRQSLWVVFLMTVIQAIIATLLRLEVPAHKTAKG